ncbi:hypothetical protein [Desulfomarina sp.]
MKVRFYSLLTVLSILFLLVVTQALNGAISLLSFKKLLVLFCAIPPAAYVT